MNRREFILATSATAMASASASAAQRSELAVEGYIFQQRADQLERPLQATIPDVLPMARRAGFRNIELNPAFFAPPGRDAVLSTLKEQGLRMPSLYVGGALHDAASAAKTIEMALADGAMCRPFGCKAIVTNPDPKGGDARKTDAELDVQAESLNRMGRTLQEHGFELRVHHHTPQLAENGREWRHILRNTDPKLVSICVDVDWAYEGGFEPIAFLREVGPRLREIHVRSARNKIWLEDLETSDIDYGKVARYLSESGLAPLVVVELAYRTQTKITRSLEEDLRLSRLYVEHVFGIQADA